jgi:hypothetical protein
MVAVWIVSNYEKLLIKGAEAKMNFYKWFFIEEKNLLQRHYIYVVSIIQKIDNLSNYICRNMIFKEII